MQTGDIIELEFIKRGKTFIVFGEITNLKNDRLTLDIWETPSTELSKWDQIVINENEIVRVDYQSEAIDYGDMGLGVH
jgi:hypothetical protein